MVNHSNQIEGTMKKIREHIIAKTIAGMLAVVALSALVGFVAALVVKTFLFAWRLI
jgi:hypothetical protein